jgi:hypothetical protein
MAGDQVRIHPKVPLDTAIAEPDRARVLGGGAPHDPTGGAGAILYDNRWAPLMVEPIATVGFVMSQKMLRGIRARAEADPIAKVAGRRGACHRLINCSSDQLPTSLNP